MKTRPVQQGSDAICIAEASNNPERRRLLFAELNWGENELKPEH